MKAILLIESYLPIFQGFYGTLFEVDEESCIEDGHTSDDYDFDYEDYRTRMATSCCEQIQKQLTDLDITIKFQKVISPKFYNFSNDSINVEYTLKEDSFKNLYKYLLENKDTFEQYITDNYSSRDGFMSFHSNKVTDWFQYLIEEDKLSHRFGACLEFYLQNEEYTDRDLYEDTQDESYVNGTLIEEEA